MVWGTYKYKLMECKIFNPNSIRVMKLKIFPIKFVLALINTSLRLGVSAYLRSLEFSINLMKWPILMDNKYKF